MTDAAPIPRLPVTSGEKGPAARQRGHAWIDARDRALHAAIAEHVRRNPALLRVAETNLDQMESSAAPGARWALRAWRRLLTELPLDDILTFLVSADPHAAELRQSTPFFGILPPAERDEIFAYYETR